MCRYWVGQRHSQPYIAVLSSGSDLVSDRGMGLCRSSRISAIRSRALPVLSRSGVGDLFSLTRQRHSQPFTQALPSRYERGREQSRRCGSGFPGERWLPFGAASARCRAARRSATPALARVRCGRLQGLWVDKFGPREQELMPDVKFRLRRDWKCRRIHLGQTLACGADLGKNGGASKRR